MFVLTRSTGAGSSALPVIGKTMQVTRDPGLEVDPALSPDGQSIAYAAGPTTAMQVYVRQVSGGRPVALTSDTTDNFRWPRWSPDGSQIAYQANDGIYVVPPLGGAPRRIARVTPGARMGSGWGTPIQGFDWSPDGSRIAWTRGYNGDGITVLTLATGDTVTLPAPDWPFSPAWSPDGKSIAVAAGNSVYRFRHRLLRQCRGCRPSGSCPSTDAHPCRSRATARSISRRNGRPTGRELYWISDRDGSRDVYRQHIGADAQAAGTPERVTTGIDAQGLSISRAGGRMAYSRLNTWSAIWSIPVPARGPVSIKGATRVTTGNETIEAVDASPDGRWLVFDSDRSGNFDLYIMSVAGGEARPLTSDAAGEYNGKWSHDGSRLVFHSLQSGNRDVYTINADGTGKQQWTSGPAQELDTDWSPAGDAVAFAILGDATQPNGFETLKLTPGAQGAFIPIASGDYVRWSPDGKSILYHGPDGLHSRRLDTGADSLFVSNVTEGAEAFYIDWSPDGKTLYYLARSAQGWSIRSKPMAGGASLAAGGLRRSCAPAHAVRIHHRREVLLLHHRLPRKRHLGRRPDPSLKLATTLPGPYLQFVTPPTSRPRSDGRRAAPLHRLVRPLPPRP